MPRVLILGATGYIGKRLADELVRSGEHRVYGVARSETKAQVLASNEVHPIICADPVNDPSPFLNVIRQQHIDVVVDVSGAFDKSSQFLNDVKAIGLERLQISGTNGKSRLPKLGFVYCSGTWIHGSNNGKPISDLDIVGTHAATAPPTLLEWRVPVEEAVLAAGDVLDVAIVRPALVYGRESTIWTAFLLPVLEAVRSGHSGTIDIPLGQDVRTGLVHVDDVASGFRKVIENLSLVNNGSVYPVFDLFTSQEALSDIFEKFSESCGQKASCKFVGPGDDVFAQAFSITQNGSSARAKQLLGWEPTRLRGFVHDMDTYALAFASEHKSHA